MKKILVLFSILLLCLLLAACTGSADGPDEPAHQHEYSTQVVAPNCTDQGYTHHYCSCGESYNDGFVAELGHQFDSYDIMTPATCEVDAVEAAICSRTGCNESDTRVVANSALGHSYTNYVYNGDAKCESDGTETAYCDRDGCAMTDFRIATDTALGHSFTNYQHSSDALCEKNAVEVAKCDRGGCDEYDFREVEGSALEHRFTEYQYNNDAKCGSDGTETSRCTQPYCGKSDTRVAVGTALEHQFTNYSPDGNATCENDGTETAYCDHGCNTTHNRVDEGSAYGHDFTIYNSNGDAKCGVDGTETAICNRYGCGASDTRTKVNSALKHQFINYWSDNNGTCTANGTMTAVCERDGCEATDVKEKPNSMIPHPVSDLWSYNSTHHWHDYTCECDLDDKVDYAEHSPDSNGKCSACGRIAPTAGLEYTLSSDGTYAILTGIGGAYGKTHIVISDEYMGVPVTTIADGVFSWNSSVRELTIPKTVTTIEGEPFSGCSNLMKVSVASIEQWLGFEFETQYSNPMSNENANQLFINGKCLEHLVVPESVTKINAHAFRNMKYLKSIELHSGFKSIGSNAFYACPSLKTIKVDSLETWLNIEFTDSASIPYLPDKVLVVNGETVTDVVIPDGITEIKPYAFYYFKNITTVKLGKDVTSIGNYAFSYCSSLRYIEFNSVLESVGQWAFVECTSLTELRLPDTVKTIGNCAFQNCTGITVVTLRGIETIGESAFNWCINLTTVIIGKDVKKISNKAFYYVYPQHYFYEGTTEDWDNITIEGSDYNVTKTAYAFLAPDAKPADTTYTYWYYDANGTPVLWS